MVWDEGWCAYEVLFELQSVRHFIGFLLLLLLYMNTIRYVWDEMAGVCYVCVCVGTPLFAYSRGGEVEHSGFEVQHAGAMFPTLHDRPIDQNAIVWFSIHRGGGGTQWVARQRGWGWGEA